MSSAPSPQRLSWQIRHTVVVSVVVLGIFLTAVILLFSDLPLVFGQPNTNQAQTWATNGTVYDMVVGGDGTVYIGGDFTFVGPQTGYGVVINTTTQARNTSYPVFYKSGGSGKIWDVISDGSGGWYVGGTFDQINGAASEELVHINADGSVDTGFTANPDAGVYDLYLYNGVLYAGGVFSTIGGASRTALAALDPDTGTALSWDPKLDSTTIYAMDSDATNLYFGGSFQSVSSTTRNSAAAVSLATAELTSWNPNFGFGSVAVIAVTTTSVYVGGNFSDVGGDASHSSFTELDKVNGAPTGWDPGPGGAIYDVEIDEDGTLFIVGAFATMGSDTRNYIAALDPVTGSSTSWNPGANQAVNEIILDGNTVYVGGNMTEVGGQTRYYLATIDKTTGTVNSNFDFALSSGVDGLALSGSNLFIGGEFTLADGVTRNNIAAINPSNGEATTWNPNANDDVYGLLISGENIYVGGKFSTIGGATRSKLAAIDLTSGLATTWDPNVTGGFSRGVDDMVLDGNTLYIGGDFTTIGSDSRTYLGAVSITTGSSTSWNPSLSGGFNGVYALAQTASSVFAGGDFTSVGGDSRSFIAEMSKTTGSSTAWNASASAAFSGSVGVITINGSTVYVGGRFSSIGGESRDNLAAVDLDTALATTWAPTGTYAGFGMGPLVSTIKVANGFAYVGGNFTALGGQTRTGIAAVDTSTGLASVWNPGLVASFSNPVNAVALDGSQVYLGGGFTAVGTNLNSNFAQFGPVDIQFTSSTWAQSETVTSITATIQISTSNTSSEDITFTIGTPGGTATYGTDYTMATGTYTIAAGQTSTSTAITVINEADFEGDETIIVTLSNPSFADLGSNTTYTYTIQNDDIVTAGVTITQSGGTTVVQETSTSTDSYTVVLDGEPTDTVTVAITPDTQTTVSTSSILFTTGNWSTPVTVTVSPVTDDIDKASPYTSTITHTATSNDNNYNGIAINDVTVSVTDNDTAGITVSAISGNTTEAGATSTFTVVLTSEPTSTVSIPVESSDLTEGTINTTTLVFTSANWDTAKTVVVTGVSDGVDDGDIAYTIITSVADASDPGYSGMNPDNVSVTNVDDDTVGVTVTQSGGTTVVTEDGGTDSYTIVLDSEPSANVTVTVTADAQSAASTSSIVFTSANWDTAVPVTVSAVNDDIDEASPHDTSITHTATSADNSYNDIEISNVNATVTDNDTAGVTVTESGGATAITEAGATDSYTLVLATEPTANVTVGVVADADTTVSTSSIVFTSANWDTPVTVTVSAVNDDIDEASPHTGTASHTVSSADGVYNGLAAASVSASITDNDTAGVTVTESAASTAVSEASVDTDSYTVVLDSEPADSVTVAISAGTQTTVSTSSVVFTSLNWDTPVTVTVSVVDDEVDEASPHTGTITHVATSNDDIYDGIAISNVSVSVTDDDTAGVTVAQSGGTTTVTEAGVTDSYTIVLDTEPTSNVTVSIAADTQTTVSTSSVVFTSANWDTPVTVTVSPVNDDIDETSPHSGTITHTAASSDTSYNDVAITSVTPSITDNDTAGVTVTESAGATVVTEAGATDTYTVVLNSEPTNNVTVAVGSDADSTASTSSIVFTSANWDTAVTVTVSGVNDDIDESSPHSSTLTHTITSVDSNYNGIETDSVTASVTDNDTAGISVSAISGNTTEAGATSTFTAVLNSEPTANVTIDVATSDATEGTVSTAQLTFTSGNWDTAQTVIATGVDDDVDDGNVAYTITLAAAASVDANYNGVNPDDVSVTNGDDDTAGVTVAQSGGTTTVTEAGVTDSYTIVLDTEPTSNVTVAIGVDADVSVSTSSVVFTSLNWDTAVMVTVTGVNDDIAEASPHTGTVTHVVTSGDGLYNGVVVGDITASITDNDTAGVTVAQSGGTTTITEGEATDTYTVVLDSEPTETVTIAVVPDAQATVSTSSISFTTLNWDTAVTVTVTAVDDQTAEDITQSSTITHAATSNDSAYNGAAVASVTASITDNDNSGGRVVAPPTPVITEPTPPVAVATQVVTLPPGEPVPVTVGGDAHTFTATEATDAEVVVRVESEPVYVTVKKGQSQDVDSNKDGLLDMRIAYNGLKNGQPELLVTELVQEHKEMFINNNDAITTSRDVQIQVNVTNAASVALSNTSDFDASGFAPVQSRVDWKLSEGFGLKTVYARLLLKDGGIVTVSDTIEYTEVGTCVLTPGQAYKTAKSPAVYYITEACTKRPFQSSRVYFTYFASFAEIHTVDDTRLNQVSDDYLGFMPLGPRAILLQGSFVKSVTHPAVYLLLRGERRHVVNETIFNALRFGWNWVEDVAGEVVEKFKVGTEIDTVVRPTYTLIKYESSPDVYLLDIDPETPGKLLKRKVQRFEDISMLGYRADTIVTVPDSEQYEDGSAVAVP